MIIKTKTSIITCRHFSVIGYFNCSWPEQLTIYVVEFVWAHNLSYPVDRRCVLYNIPGKFASPVFRQHASYSFLDLKKYTEEINLCALKKEKVFRYHKWCRWSTASRYLAAYTAVLEWSWPQILLDANDAPLWRQIIKNWKCAKLSTVSKYLVLDA